MKQHVSRRSFLGKAGLATWATANAGLVASPPARAAASKSPYPAARDTFALRKAGKKISVIFDTDIGGDIDDTWALTMLLKSPELDVRLVLSDAGNTVYRARIIAKMLEVSGRTDIPVGVGVPRGNRPGHQSEWIEGYDLSKYPGRVYEDGVGALIETIHDSEDPVSVVCVGAVPNVALALKRDLRIVKRARFVGMHGSVRRGYGGGSTPSAEANVRSDPKALQQVLAAPWDITITPLDTCGLVYLKGEKFQKVYRCQDAAVEALMENYRIWVTRPEWLKNRPDPTKTSTTLFDTVAVYLAYSEELVRMETLGIRVTDDGYTVIDEKARPVRCAMNWKNLGAFEDHLVDRLTSSS